MRRAVLVAVSLVVVAPYARAFQADFVPASRRIEAREIEGSISITGADGTVRVRIAGVNDAQGNSLGSGTVSAHLRLRVNGARRRVSILLAVEDGDGEANASLGLHADDRVIVRDVRVRGPDRRLLAQAGVVTEDVESPAPPAPAPSPEECPDALASCQSDLVECNADLDECESL
jgi:hypothetical protein